MVLGWLCQISSNTDGPREQLMILRKVLVLPMLVLNVELEKILRIDVPGRKRYSLQGLRVENMQFAPAPGL